MGWNYEKGCEDPKAYTSGMGPITPEPPKFYTRGCQEILYWEGLEAAWKRDRNWQTGYVIRSVVIAWEKAEMAIVGWDKRSQVEQFRRGYLEWLASSSGVADALSDLEIEQLPMIERLVARGYREMAKAAHPDTGGSKEAFHELRQAKTQLDRILIEVGDLLKEPV